MSWTFVACVGIAFAWMALFYLWGRGFLTWIKAERDVASCIPFGYLVLQVIYQVIYLPFYFTRGSYRATVYIWLGIVVIGSIVLIFYLRKHRSEQPRSKQLHRRSSGLARAWAPGQCERFWPGGKDCRHQGDWSRSRCLCGRLCRVDFHRQRQ